MQNILEIFGLNKTVGEFGIEIETEGSNIQYVEPGNGNIWSTVKDGSLRGEYPHGAAEFVMSRPCLFRYMEKHLDTLIEKQKNAEFAFSFRTSVHVHMNVQTLTEAQVFNIIYTYYLLESVLVKYCGEHREANRFCLRLQDSDGCYDVIRDLMSGGINRLRLHSQEQLRYAALNLAAITKYGSLEFRSMRGTLDKSVILNWVTALNNIKKFAVNYADVRDIHEKFLELGSLSFMREVLKGVYEEFLTETSEQQINLGFSLSIDIPFMYKLLVARREKEKEYEEPPVAPRGVARKPVRMQDLLDALPQGINPAPVHFEHPNFPEDGDI